MARAKATRSWALAPLLATACAHAGPRIDEEALNRATTRAAVPPGEIVVRWLGAAGFEIRTRGGTLLVDPFLTRPGAGQILFGRVVPDEPTLARAVPEADLVLIGHSHFDHVMDASSIARRTGATVAGSRTTCLVTARMGLPADRCRAVRGGARIQTHGFFVTAVPSQHAPTTVLGAPRGRLSRAPRWRVPSAWELPMGRVFAWVIRTEGITVVHLSSAALPADPSVLERAVPEGADVVLTAIGGRAPAPNLGRALIAMLKPRVIVPHHFDALTRPLPAVLPAASRSLAERFAREAAGAYVQIPAPLSPMRFSRDELRQRPRARVRGALRAP